MKYGTICGKHNECISEAENIQKEVSNIQRLFSDVDASDPDSVEAFMKNFALIENLLTMIDDSARSIHGTIELCLDDGQRMEDGLVKKQHKINELCDEVEKLEKDNSDLENTISNLNDDIDTYKEEISDLSDIVNHMNHPMRG